MYFLCLVVLNPRTTVSRDQNHPSRSQAGTKMVSYGCFLLASVVSLSVSVPVSSMERSFFTNSKKTQASAAFNHAPTHFYLRAIEVVAWLLRESELLNRNTSVPLR